METSGRDKGPLFIVYKGKYNDKTGIFLETVNPNTMSFGAVYLIDLNCEGINRILVGSNLLVVSYY